MRAEEALYCSISVYINRSSVVAGYFTYYYRRTSLLYITHIAYYIHVYMYMCVYGDAGGSMYENSATSSRVYVRIAIDRIYIRTLRSTHAYDARRLPMYATHTHSHLEVV